MTTAAWATSMLRLQHESGININVRIYIVQYCVFFNKLYLCYYIISIVCVYEIII